MSERDAPEALPALRPLPWQHAAWQRIRAVRDADRLTHAWLLLGPAGIGRRSFAGALTAALLCKAPDADGVACGDCVSCRALVGAAHPDAHLLGLDGHLGLAANHTLLREESIAHWTPSKESKRRDIGVEAVRSLIDKLSVASHAAGRKLVVLTPAESLNEASANALLKLIEEPPAGTVLILVAEQLADLKATLISRCQRLALPSPDEATAEAWLAGVRPQIAAAQRSEALQAARGAPLRAVELLDGDGLRQRAGWRDTLSQLSAGRQDPVQAAAALNKAEPASFILWWIESLIGLLRQRAAGASAGEGAFLVGALPAGLGAEAVERALQGALDARRALDRNANALLVLETLLIDWRSAITSAAK